MSDDQIEIIDDIPEIEIAELDEYETNISKQIRKQDNPNSGDNEKNISGTEITKIKHIQEPEKNDEKSYVPAYENNVGHEANEKISSKKNLLKIENDDNSEKSIDQDKKGGDYENYEVTSMQEDELMMKINKEAELVSDKITHNELNIFSKYDKLSEHEIRLLLKEKSKEIISLSRTQDKYKDNLSNLIDGLNDAIDKSQALLIKREKNPQNMKSLEHILSIRQKELANTKSQTKIYRQQFELLANKANDKCSSERLNDMEEQIDLIKKENLDLTKKVRNLKNTQIMQSKELEVCNKNKKYPQKINSQTEEVKNLVAKKHEYFSKLNNNKKSLSNMKVYLQRVSKMFKDVLSNPKFNNKSNESSIRQVEQDLGWISEELKGTDDEILDKIHNPLSNPLNMYRQGNLLLNKGIKNSPISDLIKIKHKSPSPNKVILPKIISNVNRSKSKGKYGTYNTSNTSNKSPRKNEYNFNEGNSNSEILNEEISYEYENTYDSDYHNLLKKREQFEKINFKIEKNMKEIEKLYDKKFKDLNNTIEHNQKKLKLMQQQNDLLSLEIQDLSKIIKLNIEESKLKKEIKDSESKIFKSLTPNIMTNAHNDVSETRNDILQELNNFHGNEINDGNVIEEENVDANSILVQGNNENNENKNLKFPDISNVEVLEEETDMNRRERKLNNIRSKYISIDNEINFSERNS